MLQHLHQGIIASATIAGFDTEHGSLVVIEIATARGQFVQVEIAIRVASPAPVEVEIVSKETATLGAELKSIATSMEGLAAMPPARGQGTEMPISDAGADPEALAETLKALESSMKTIERKLSGLYAEVGELATAASADSRTTGWPNLSNPPLPLPGMPQGLAMPPMPGQTTSPAAVAGRAGDSQGTEISPSSRARLESAIQEQMSRTKELIEQEAINPDNPDPADVMRAMQYANEETMAELRATLPPEEFRAIFPAEAQGTNDYSR